ncbi:hypothetical protein LWF15_13880 [Kineosporia rhizophila]|uniref:hypothetical protein n=1 Tax=Kineosporia rhizophila TaxID=84633 RepID=UPI001E511ABA|nr:hypothetical protein [Kineosporia rhizophila]MCE0536597.1 hypothetical protein [Kineosporia rhizophila]
MTALVDRYGAGIMLTNTGYGKKSASFEQALQVAIAADVVVCADMALYAGNDRKLAHEGVSPDWIHYQRQRGMKPIADSGYVDADDLNGMRTILIQSARQGAMALLPIHVSWVADDMKRAQLLTEINRVGVPVALALEHKVDPLGRKDSVGGLIRLLDEAKVPVWLIRSDVSALGAVAFGAEAGAIGTSTKLRHFYPRVERKPGQTTGGRRALTAAVVQECLAYVSVDKIGQAYMATPDVSVWECQGWCCAGRPIIRIAMETDSELQSQMAYEHSLNALFAIRDSMIGDGLESLTQRQSWYARCQNAQYRALDIQSQYEKWPAPNFIGAWRSMIIEHAPEAVV